MWSYLRVSGRSAWSIRGGSDTFRRRSPKLPDGFIQIWPNFQSVDTATNQLVLKKLEFSGWWFRCPPEKVYHCSDHLPGLKSEFGCVPAKNAGQHAKSEAHHENETRHQLLGGPTPFSVVEATVACSNICGVSGRCLKHATSSTKRSCTCLSQTTELAHGFTLKRCW